MNVTDKEAMEITKYHKLNQFQNNHNVKFGLAIISSSVLTVSCEFCRFKSVMVVRTQSPDV